LFDILLILIHNIVTIRTGVTMSIIIDSIQQDYKRSKNSTRDHARVYLNYGEVHEMLDEWFYDNNIAALAVKSKAWNKIKRAINKLATSRISSTLNVNCSDIRFSQKCGCSCGCSPGYIVKNVKDVYRCTNIWCTLKLDDVEIKDLQSLLQSKEITDLLLRDIEASKQIKG